MLATILAAAAVEGRRMATSTRDLGIQLEEIATRIAEQRAQEIDRSASSLTS